MFVFFICFFFSWFGVPRQRIFIYLPCEQRPVAAHTHTHISLLYPLPSPTPFSSEMFRFSSVISAHLLAYDHQCTEHLVRMKLCWGNWWEMRHTRCQPEILKHWKCVGFPKTGKEHQQKKKGREDTNNIEYQCTDNDCYSIVTYVLIWHQLCLFGIYPSFDELEFVEHFQWLCVSLTGVVVFGGYKSQQLCCYWLQNMFRF